MRPFIIRNEDGRNNMFAPTQYCASLVAARRIEKGEILKLFSNLEFIKEATQSRVEGALDHKPLIIKEDTRIIMSMFLIFIYIFTSDLSIIFLFLSHLHAGSCNNTNKSDSEDSSDVSVREMTSEDEGVTAPC